MVLSDWPDLRRPAFKTNFPSYLKKKLPHCSEKNFCSQGSQVASFWGRKRHLFVKDCPGEMCWHKARQMTKLDLSYKSLSDILQPPHTFPLPFSDGVSQEQILTWWWFLALRYLRYHINDVSTTEHLSTLIFWGKLNLEQQDHLVIYRMQ